MMPPILFYAWMIANVNYFLPEKQCFADMDAEGYDRDSIQFNSDWTHFLVEKGLISCRRFDGTRWRGKR